MTNNISSTSAFNNTLLEGKIDPTITVICLTSSGKEDLSDTVQKIEKSCKKYGVKFHAILTNYAYIDESKIKSNLVKIQNIDGKGTEAEINPKNTVCFSRGGVINTQIGSALLTILENSGTFVINEKRAMELCANKLSTAIELERLKIQVPKTAYVANESSIKLALNKIGNKFPVVVKTLTGAEGIGVSIIDSYTSLKSVLQTLWKYKAEVLIQEYLEIKNDVRSLVLDGKIVAAAKRDKASEDFRTNLALGASGGPYKLSEEEVKLVEKAAKASGCYYVGIDHVVSGGKPYIIEMNSSPGSSNVYRSYFEDDSGKNITGQDLIDKIVKYCLDKNNWRYTFKEAGLVEKMSIPELKQSFNAKLDTGNESYNVLSSKDIKVNKEETKVTFTVNGVTITKPVVSFVRIRTNYKDVERRPVVSFDISFRNRIIKDVRFSLTNRETNKYPILVGLKFLDQTKISVNVNKKFALPEENMENINNQFKILTEKYNKRVPKDKKTNLPKRYVSKLSTFEKIKRKKEFEKRKHLPKSDPRAYKPFKSDRKFKNQVKPSKYTLKYRQMFNNSHDMLSVLDNVEYMVENNIPLNDILKYCVETKENIFNIISESNDESQIKQLKLQIEAISDITDKIKLNGYKTMEIEDINSLYENYMQDVYFSILSDDELPEDVKYIKNCIEIDLISTNKLDEIAPPSGEAKRFVEKEKVIKAFKNAYGKEWKSILYATAWKMFSGKKVKKESLDNKDENLEGTDSLVKKYKKATPGQVSSLKEFLEESKEDKNKEDYKTWKKLVNMGAKEIQSFLDSQDGKKAGLSRKEASNAGTGGRKITSGRDSARAIIRMKSKPRSEWDENDYRWMRKQISFISRMKGAKGPLYDDKNRPTRKLLALKVWGHNPTKGG